MDGSNDLDLRGHYGEPSERAVKKQLDRLDKHCIRFIELSPFLVLGTSGADGRQDVSPRGDPPGFVTVLDERTLLLPDRPGNRRLDSLGNLQTNDQVGLLFLIPGVDETLRVNGRARITVAEELLGRCTVAGRKPPSALLIAVEEVYLHCAKALIRSKLWHPESIVERSVLPTLGRMISEQIGDGSVAEADVQIARAYRDNLY